MDSPPLRLYTYTSACFALLTIAYARLLGKRETCQQMCDAAQCPIPPQVCYYGRVKDFCGCCVVCAAGEGEDCRGLACGEGLRCERRSHERPGVRVCVCESNGAICGSDGRTYPSICRLRAENHRAEMENMPLVTMVQRGECHASGKVEFNLFFYFFALSVLPSLSLSLFLPLSSISICFYNAFSLLFVSSHTQEQIHSLQQVNKNGNGKSLLGAGALRAAVVMSFKAH
uniref:IGFBP N-terminal domain-containing protein n=1 Tax=Periophthalmus magnuspinnatus TaxID=409849 RepID=A0A3B4BDH0_9GOBI